MPDFLLREQAPLTPKEWELIDNVVVQTARRQLVGRRFLNLVGPLGAGVQEVPTYVFVGIEPGTLSVLGEADPRPIKATERLHPVIPLIYKDFWIYWRDIETSRRFGVPLSLSPAAAAASFVGQREDDLIFNGSVDMGYSGLTNVAGRNVLSKSDWGKMGSAFGDAVGAMQRLVSQGFYGPFALVVSPSLYASMARVYENTGVLEIEQVRKIMTAGVYQTPVLTDDIALVLSTGAQNFDLVVAQDLITAYLTPENLNHAFRVLEAIVLRIHRPGAICTLETRVPAEEEEIPPRRRR
ncbi:MAG: bacteriocin family protein [Chloroflexi bacterium]|nr:bacteriocin family protein [Chloroflexota bacterium]